MKTLTELVLVSATCLACAAMGQESSSLQRWRFRFDIGGTIPEDPTLSEISGPVTSGGKMELSAGMQFDFAAGYRVTPWLTLEGELGFRFNEVDSVGNWSYRDSALAQMTMMFNVEFNYPRWPLVPFAGIGAGGVLSFLTFGNYYDDFYYSDSDGSGTDFVPAAQAFAGLRYEFNKQWSLGVTYRFLATGSQKWDVEWWDGIDFEVGVDRVCIHSVCLAISGKF
jgi:opacity protein-like surface antigen